MKKLSVILIALTTLYGCSNAKEENKNLQEILASGTLEELRDTRLEVSAAYDSVGLILTEIEKAIARIDTTQKLPLVTAFKVEETPFKTFLPVQANVKTKKNILIYPEYAGVLKELKVKAGQRVKKGQVLAIIDDGGLTERLAALEAQYELAKTTYERQARLWEQKIGSEIQYLQTKTNMESADKARTEMRAQIAKTEIKAPFAGVVDEVITEQGQVLIPGVQSIVRLVNLDEVYVKAAVPEKYIAVIKKGTEVLIEFPALNKTKKGKVRVAANYIDPKNRTFDIEVNFSNNNWSVKPNQMARLNLNNYTNPKALLVPMRSIKENSLGDQFVFVLDEKEGRYKTVQRQVETGKTDKGMVEILTGLDKGQLIVNEGAQTLNHDEKVMVKPNI